MKTAVVFDSAGTLLKVYRVAKDIAQNRIVENVVSTNMVVKGHGCALVALRIDSADMIDMIDPGITISDFISGAGIGLDVICRDTMCPGERITMAAVEDRMAKVRDIKEAITAVKLKCKDIYYVNIGLVVDVPGKSIPYVLATGGKTFPGVRGMIERIMLSGVDVYIASGDNRKSLLSLAMELGMPEKNVFDAVSPSGKRDIVTGLKDRYERVIMVGDGINDQLAFEAADLSVLSVQQDGTRPGVLYESADIVIKDILQVESIIRESLHMINMKM